MTTDHKPIVTTVQTFYLDSPEWIATCPACQWRDHVAINRSLIVASANAHEWHYHPDRRPAPEPTPPAHGLRAERQNRGGTEVRMDCYCGLGWTGGPTAVRERFAEHLAKFGAAAG